VCGAHSILAGGANIEIVAPIMHQTFYKKAVEVVWGYTSPTKPKQPQKLGKAVGSVQAPF
jgi:hypothetical protein